MGMRNVSTKIRLLVLDWKSYYICLCRGAAFTTGLLGSHYFARNAVVSVLITYFTTTFHGNLSVAVSLTIALDVLSAISGFVMTYVSEERVSPLKVVRIASLSYMMGLIMLCFSAYGVTYAGSVGYFVVVVYLLAVGQGGGESILKTILMNQLSAHEPLTDPPDEERKEARGRVWWTPASILCSVLAAAMLNSVKWKPTFISSTSVMGVGILIFSCAIPLFHRSSTVHPLDKPSHINQWKEIWKMIPMCIPFVFFGLVLSAGNTYYLEQASTTGVSIYVLIMLQKVCKHGSSYLFDILMKKITLLQPKRFIIVRIGFGLLVCLICCVVAFHFVVKTDLHIEDVENCGPNDYNISVSNNWLIPQFCLLGLMEGIGQGGLEEFFKFQVRTSMEVYGSATSECVTVIGSVLNGVLVHTTGWFGGTLSCSLLDHYYFLLIQLSTSNIVMYAFFSVFYWKNRKESGDNDPATQGDGEGDASV